MKVSSASDDMSEIDPSGIFEILGLGIALHLMYLVLNFTLATALKFDLDAKKSVVIMCSQKTLPVAVAIIDFLPSKPTDKGYLGEHGIMVIACILAHFVQIVIDAFVASYWSTITSDSSIDGDKSSVLPTTLLTSSSNGPSKGGDELEMPSSR